MVRRLRHDASPKRRNLKTPVLRFRVNEKISKMKLFENDDVKIITSLPRASFQQTQIQNGWGTGDCFQISPT